MRILIGAIAALVEVFSRNKSRSVQNEHYRKMNDEWFDEYKKTRESLDGHDRTCFEWVALHANDEQIARKWLGLMSSRENKMLCKKYFEEKGWQWYV